MSTYLAILMICAVFIVGEILSKLVSYKVTGYCGLRYIIYAGSEMS